jgi:uncharacterized protein (DUF1330 family)
MPLRLCVLLWEHTGRGGDLAAFEDEVLALLVNHGGRLLSRDSVVDRHDGDPLEVQLIEVPDEAALAGYLRDPARIDLAHATAMPSSLERSFCASNPAAKDPLRSCFRSWWPTCRFKWSCV